MELYPEHEKLHEIKDQSQSIGEFFDWLRSKGLLICKYREQVGIVFGPGEFEEAGYFPENTAIQILLSEFFGINRQKLEEEKQAMLKEL